jgi:hypothetical protein
LRNGEMEYPYMEKYDDTWNTMEANFSVSHFFYLYQKF